MEKVMAELRDAFSEFRQKNDKRLDAIEAKTNDFDRVYSKMQRLSIGSGGGGIAQEGGEFFVIDARGNTIPILARGEKLSARFPRPAEGGEEFSIGDFVRASMGVKTIRAADVSRGTSLVPTYISSEIIDAVREKARIIQAGAGTIVIQGPTNLCRVASDPTIIEHTESANDLTESAPVFEAVSLDPKTLAALIPLSLEVVQDSPNLDAALRMSIAGAFAAKLDALSVAKILADASIPTSATGQDCATWAGILAGVGSAIAADQDIPKALISGAGDYIARAAQLASTAGSWLGAPPALAGMTDLFTGGMADGTAVFGDFARGFAIAVRQELNVEVVRWGKASYGSHLLVASARMAGYVLQPKTLYIQQTTVA